MESNCRTSKDGAAKFWTQVRRISEGAESVVKVVMLERGWEAGFAGAAAFFEESNCQNASARIYLGAFHG